MYSAHSSMSCFLLSCAISAIRRPAGAVRSMAMQILSFCPANGWLRLRSGCAACGEDAADLRGLLFAVAIEDRVQVVQVAGRGVACQVALRGVARAARLSARLAVCVPKTSSTSCDQAIFVDQATDASLFSDAVLGEVD